MQQPKAVGGLPVRLAEHRDPEHQLGVGAAERLHPLAEGGELVLERHPAREAEVRIGAPPGLGRG